MLASAYLCISPQHTLKSEVDYIFEFKEKCCIDIGRCSDKLPQTLLPRSTTKHLIISIELSAWTARGRQKCEGLKPESPCTCKRLVCHGTCGSQGEGRQEYDKGERGGREARLRGGGVGSGERERRRESGRGKQEG